MAKAILAIDQGTTSSRAILLDKELNVLGIGQKEFEQIYPKPGWVEHNANEIWWTTEYAIRTALEKAELPASEIAAIGITNQRETIVVWDKNSGEPAYNAIVWQCRRTGELCKQLIEAGHEPLFTEKTGLIIDPYFSGTKLKWLLENVQGLKKKALADDIKAGTIDSYLVYRLTGGGAHVSDVSNASRTLLMNIHELAWDEKLAEILDVPLSIMPKIVSNAEVYGHTKGLGILPDGIPISGMAGDQQAALFGQACFNKGEAKCTYGTGAFLLMNTGEEAVKSDNRLLTTVAWKIGEKTTYALEGSAFIAGAAVQWLRDGLGIIEKSSDVEALAKKVDSSDGVIFVPAFVGLGAPHWRSDARAILTGVTRGTTKAHLARATLEGIAMQNYEILKAMEKDSGLSLKALKVDGGASANDLLMQFQSDILDTEIIRPELIETTVLGAAFMAGLATGFWENLEDIRKSWKEAKRFTASMPERKRQEFITRWNDAILKA